MEDLSQNLDWIAPTFVALVAVGVAVWAAVVAQKAKAAAERSASADEAMAAMALAEREAAAEELRLRPWRETPTGRGKARITNQGPRAFNVGTSMDAQFVDVDEGGEVLKVVEPGESFNVTYMLAASDTGQLTLTWATEDGDDVERISQRLAL